MSDWIEWNGGECPVSSDTVVEVRLPLGNKLGPLRACHVPWLPINGGTSSVIAYRIIKEDPEAIQGFSSQVEQAVLKAQIKGDAGFCDPWPTIDFNASGSKYLRNIQTIGGKVDVYAVLEAFAVTCPARQHAIKKLLCAGLRGKGDSVQDLKEAADAVARAVQMEEARVSTT